MSERNSTQAMPFTQKMLGRWAVFCVKNPHLVLTLCVLFSLAGYSAAWWLWFPYSSPVSQLPKNFDERLAWEETSRRIQFNSDIMFRVSISDSVRCSPVSGDRRMPGQSHSTEDRLGEAVALLKSKLSGSRKYFSDVITSRDLEPKSTQELYELPDDDLQTLYGELLDARQVLGGKWAWLESASFADWLAARLNQSQTEISRIASQPSNQQAAFVENRRLLATAARFITGLHQNLSQPVTQQNGELITPWLLDPDKVMVKTESRTGNRNHGNATPQDNTRVIVWARLAEPQLSNLLDRRVIGKQKKIDHKLVGKLNASMTELFDIVEKTREKFADIDIEPFGVPVDVYHGQTGRFPMRTAGTFVMAAVLTLLFIAGLGHVRVYLMILIATACSFGTYLGFCAPWFEIITPFVIFVGVAVPLFGICAGVLQAATYRNALDRGRSVPDAVIEMMQSSGKSTLCGGVISVAVFLSGVFYLWWYPVEPTSATLSFRSSLVGVNLTLFLLAQSVLACLVGQLAILPALLYLAEPDGMEDTSHWEKMSDTQVPLGPTKALPTIPLPATVLLMFVMLGSCLYCVTRPGTTAKHTERDFVTPSEKQAAVMPILVSHEQSVQVGIGEIPGLFVCDAAGLVANTDANRSVIIDNMTRFAEHTSVPQKIPLPDHRSLSDSLRELHARLAEQFTELQKNAAIDKSTTTSLQQDIGLCRLTGEQIIAVCQLLTQIPQQAYGERIDAWQQAIASDLVMQQRSLQKCLHRTDRVGLEVPSTIAKRFLGADQQSLVWVFPVENWQAITSQEHSAPVIDLLLDRVNQVKMQTGHTLSAQGGFPLLVLNGRQLMRQQLPVVGAVTLAAMLVMILLAHQSVVTATMTVLTILGGLSLYGLVITTLGIPFGKITLFPVAFFPLIVPLFLDLFRRSGVSRHHFRGNLGGTMICFGVGIVIVGHLMFSPDAAMVIAARAMTIGWIALMLPLMLTIVSVPQMVKDGLTPTKTGQVIAPTHYTPQPASPATRDQFDFYRERIEATRVFDQDAPRETPLKMETVLPNVTVPQYEDPPKKEVPLTKETILSKEAAPPMVAADRRTTVIPLIDAQSEKTIIPVSHTPFPLPEGAVQPIFPPVWNFGTKRRATNRIVVELAKDAVSDHDMVVSLAAPNARTVPGKLPKTMLTAKTPQQLPGENREYNPESTNILPMHRNDKATDTKQTPSRNKTG